jgi:L-2-hydroxyglutarate oxidase LhgO
MFDSEITIIGAGVVGLAIAEKLSEDHKNVFVIEKNKTFGQETSSRNSEVIHAGIYYPEGSLKARLCVAGKNLLYEYCRKYDIPFKNCGKLIVATSVKEIPILEKIKKTALNNGVNDLMFKNRDEILNLEPCISSLKALYSPSTGIIDSHSLMKQFETNSINNGTQCVYNTEVIGIKSIDHGYEILLLNPDGSKFSFTSGLVINSAGLNSDIISAMVGLEDDSLKIHFCKGEYFKLNPPKNKLVNGLIYPVPNPNLEGVGIHVTIDLGGGVKLGPDVTYLDSNIYDYKVTSSKQEDFYKSAKRFLPFLELNDLSPEMAGIRPKIQRSGEPVRDFYIMEESKRGCPGFVNLIGIESPGLTAAIAIADYVRSLLD